MERENKGLYCVVIRLYYGKSGEGGVEEKVFENLF